MPVMIRMARHGAKRKPIYNIIAIEKSRRRNGRFLERLGQFNPKQEDEKKKLTLNKDALEAWVKKGARVSETVGHLVKHHAKYN